MGDKQRGHLPYTHVLRHLLTHPGPSLLNRVVGTVLKFCSGRLADYHDREMPGKGDGIGGSKGAYNGTECALSST